MTKFGGGLAKKTIEEQAKIAFEKYWKDNTNLKPEQKGSWEIQPQDIKNAWIKKLIPEAEDEVKPVFEKHEQDLEKRGMSFEEIAKQLFDNEEANHASGKKPVWEDQPQNIKDVWIAKINRVDLSEESEYEGERSLDYLEKTIHLTIHITGDSADEINYLHVLQEYIDDMNFFTPVKITSGNQNTYYTEKKVNGGVNKVK